MAALPDEPLIAVCPVSVRTDDDDEPAATRCRPCSPRSPPTSTTRPSGSTAIHEVTKGAKEEHNAVGADMLQNWAEFAGPNTFNLGVAPVLEPRAWPTATGRSTT